ncbi:MAG TPA: 2-oxoacid:acceptor oxidoreductase family protein [Iamia sp.]|nr:2-oxoacid:acceptor oxidoreductase family protein [Iamia sp.]
MSVGRDERVVIATGIGGQGVQLASQVLAHAAMAEGLEVLLFGSYGGMMRGGNTDATVVLGRGPVDVPPVAPTAWAGLVMHHEYVEPLADRLTPESLVFVNASVVPAETFAGRPGTVVPVDAVEVAKEAGSALGAAMVLLGALAGGTGLVGLDALQAAVVEVIPPYRTQHVEVNQRALALGHALAPDAPPAWPTAGVPR